MKGKTRKRSGLMCALALGMVSTSVLAGEDARSDYTRNVAIVIWEGAEILDWGGPSEVFESASRYGEDRGAKAFNVYTVSKTTEPITSQRFIKVIPEYDITNAPKPDIIVLPGGGTSSVLNDPEFLEWAGSAAREAELALSVCTGAFILAESGLLDGMQATTWYGALDYFEEQYEQVDVNRGRRFVDNGQFVTTAGVSAGIDGALHVVARLVGRQVADRTAEYMEYSWTPEPYLARDYKYLNPDLDATGRELQQANIFRKEKNYAAAIAIYESILKDNKSNIPALFMSGRTYYDMERYEDSIGAYVAASKADDVFARSMYGAACSASLLNDTKRGIEYLQAAIKGDPKMAEYSKTDPDLEAVRSDPRFTQLVATTTP